MKKRKKTKKNKAFSKKKIENLILSYFKKHPEKNLNYKQVSKILKIKDPTTKLLVSEVLKRLSLSKVLEEVKKGCFKLIFSEEKKTGLVVSVSFSGCFLKIDDYNDEVFVDHENSLFSLKNDLVEVLVFSKRKGRFIGRVVRVLNRSCDVFVGKIELFKSSGFLIPDDRHIPFDVFIPKKNLTRSVFNKKVLVKITSWSDNNKNPIGKIIKVIGNLNDHETEIHSILYQYSLDPFFPKSVEKESSKISGEISSSEIKKRVDFRNITTFTIDPEDAKDFDDALSVNFINDDCFEIGVHIADVSYYVKPGGLINNEAEKRCNSIYLVDRTIPMLPEYLSNNLCSLNPNVDRLCYSVILMMNKKTDILSYQIKKTIINSDKRFTYKDSQKIINNMSGLFSKELILLNSLSKKMRKKRFSSGSINFEREEVKFVLDKKNNPVDVFFKESLDTNHLVEEFMLTANKIVAKEIGNYKKGKKKKSFVYRVHDVPDKEKIDSLNKIIKKFGYSINTDPSKISSSINGLLKKIKGSPESNMIETLTIRSMSKAFYTTKNIGHYGLNFPFYSHFTSPIRRYPDLIVHRLLKKYLDVGISDNKNSLEKICHSCSQKEIVSSMAERDSIKYMQSKFLQNKIGESFNGIISGVTDWGIYVELINNKCEGLVKISSLKNDFFVFDQKIYSIIGSNTGKKYQLGDNIKVIIESIDLEKRQINFKLY